jgi:hypothetical protein
LPCRPAARRARDELRDTGVRQAGVESPAGRRHSRHVLQRLLEAKRPAAGDQQRAVEVPEGATRRFTRRRDQRSATAASAADSIDPASATAFSSVRSTGTGARIARAIARAGTDDPLVVGSEAELRTFERISANESTSSVIPKPA